MVVYDICQMVRRQPVSRFPKDFVVEYCRVDTYFATYYVVDDNLFVGLYPDADYIFFAVRYASAYFVGGQYQRVVHRHSCGGIVLEVGCLRAFFLEFFGCVECVIRFAVCDKSVDIFAVDVFAFALAVRCVFATERDTFVELYTKPLERVYDIFFGTFHIAIGIGVFYPQYHCASVTASKEVVVEGSADTSYMKSSRWRRSETYSGCGVHFRIFG